MNYKDKPLKELLNFAIINLDKPSGPTSFQVSQYVKIALNACNLDHPEVQNNKKELPDIKKALKISKTSHLGTLDPKVTGVLPVALGRACRLNDYLMHADKTYVGIMRVHKKTTKTELEPIIKSFIGKIKQLPPVRSSVKRAIREREIKTFKILEISKDGKDVLFETKVQAGTYIRKLCSDIGEKITGSPGAHMLELRRTQAGQFTESQETFINLYDLDKALEEDNLKEILIPAEQAIKNSLPEVQLNSKNLKKFLTGKPLMKSDLKETPNEEIFAAFIKDKFIGIYKSFKDKDSDIVAKPEFVYN